MPRIRICNVEVDNLTMAGAVQRVDELVKRTLPALVVTPNVDHIVQLDRDRDFALVYGAADLVLADGVPLLWASRLLGTPLIAKVSGSDLFPELCRLASERGYGVFFLGGRPGAADAAARRMQELLPELRIAGTYCPPYGFHLDERQNDDALDAVRRAKPHLLFVGLGAPKQEKWIHRHYRGLGVPLSIGVGVTFEFVAGMVNRAPRWMQRIGLEWFWRLLMEPRRLWKRYLVDDPRFIGLVLRQLWSSRFASR